MWLGLDLQNWGAPFLPQNFPNCFEKKCCHPTLGNFGRDRAPILQIQPTTDPIPHSLPCKVSCPMLVPSIQDTTAFATRVAELMEKQLEAVPASAQKHRKGTYISCLHKLAPPPMSRPKTRRWVGPSWIHECSLAWGKQIRHWSARLHKQSWVERTGVKESLRILWIESSSGKGRQNSLRCGYWPNPPPL